MCGCIDYLSIAEPGAWFLFLALATLILGFFVPAAGLNWPFSLHSRVRVLHKICCFFVWPLRVLNGRTGVCVRSRVKDTPWSESIAFCYYGYRNTVVWELKKNRKCADWTFIYANVPVVCLLTELWMKIIIKSFDGVCWAKFLRLMRHGENAALSRGLEQSHSISPYTLGHHSPPCFMQHSHSL